MALSDPVLFSDRPIVELTFEEARRSMIDAELQSIEQAAAKALRIVRRYSREDDHLRSVMSSAAAAARRLVRKE